MAAWAAEVPDRIEFFRNLANGRRVLDIGCVNHEWSTMAHPAWLHRHIAEVAKECLGVDILEEGVAEMCKAGFDAIALDINEGPNAAVLARMPFDVVTAGELIEHLPSPQALFDFAFDVLKPGGQLVLSTPNPYTLGRMRAGQLRTVWENVDHVAYLFPSGIAEMADRSGMTLTVAGTATAPPVGRAVVGSTRDLAKAVVKRLLRAQSERASGRLGLPLPPGWASPTDLLFFRLTRGRLAMGESGVFVIEKPASGGEA
jgi:2-polyprenyl-3-methyl-5-hydroxy-6-metoxy-1,4-benzoquinol methylase